MKCRERVGKLLGPVFQRTLSWLHRAACLATGLSGVSTGLAAPPLVAHPVTQLRQARQIGLLKALSNQMLKKLGSGALSVASVLHVNSGFSKLGPCEERPRCLACLLNTRLAHVLASCCYEERTRWMSAKSLLMIRGVPVERAAAAVCTDNFIDNLLSILVGFLDSSSRVRIACSKSVGLSRTAPKSTWLRNLGRRRRRPCGVDLGSVGHVTRAAALQNAGIVKDPATE